MGSKFVKEYGVTRLLHVETFDDPESAIRREKQLKKWNRDWTIRFDRRRESLLGRSDTPFTMTTVFIIPSPHGVWVPAFAGTIS
jgi:hypothetical protein